MTVSIAVHKIGEAPDSPGERDGERAIGIGMESDIGVHRHAQALNHNDR